MILVSDDGTLDTVLVCSDCGAELRYNWDGDSGSHSNAANSGYDAFVEWAIEDATTAHVCEEEKE